MCAVLGSHDSSEVAFCTAARRCVVPLIATSVAADCDCRLATRKSLLTRRALLYLPKSSFQVVRQLGNVLKHHMQSIYPQTVHVERL